MWAMHWRRVSWGRVGRTLAGQLLALTAATVVVGLLEYAAGIHPASSVYLLAVASMAIAFGTWAAIGTAFGGFLTYNFLFVDPKYTFTVTEPQEILNLLLLLTLGILIGRLTGLQRDRAAEALRREQEARALFAVSRALASARKARDALGPIVERLAAETRMTRVWVGLGPTIAQEQVAADSGAPAAQPPIGTHFLLRRTPAENRSEWARISPPIRPAPRAQPPNVYRVAINDGTDEIGSVWALRNRSSGEPTIEETRLLAATADQVGQALLRDRLASQATELEIARRGDELKTALLDSVSHDLRTPLATIRAAAGSLADPEIAWTEADRSRTARQIDLEADRLNRIVSNLLDMSRIEAGALRPEVEVLPLEDVVWAVLSRCGPSLGDRPVRLEMPPDLPPVLADPVMIEEVLVNLVENVGRYTPAHAPVLIAAGREGSRIVLSVEDGGPGLPSEASDKIFDKFYRHPSTRSQSGRGTGLGLAVVQGMVEAMGGQVSASRSELGGLAVRIELPAGSPAPSSMSREDPSE
jgi:two-component system sensor histidine kinase KdpD